MKKVVVVGAGLAGLLAAYEASLAGYEVELFESSDKVGGTISTIELAGAKIDSGAESFAITRPETLSLINELGLSNQVTHPTRSDARILSDSDFFTIPHGLMGIPSDFSDLETIAILGKEVAKKASELDSLPWNINDEKSLGDVVKIRMGDDVVKKIVDPIVAGVHSSSSAQLEMESVLPGLLELAQKYNSLSQAVKEIRGNSARPGSAVASLKGGVHVLVDRLVEVLKERGVKINESTRVISIEYHNVWRTILSSHSVESDYLVLAVKPKSLNQILLQFPQLVDNINRIESTDVALVFLALISPKLSEQPRGSGVLVADRGSKVVAKGSTHVTAKWSWLKEQIPNNVELVRLSYGRNGEAIPEVADLLAYAKLDVCEIYGITDPDVIDAKVVLWPQSLVQSKIGHKSNLQRIFHEVRKIPGLAIVGSSFSGNGIAGVVKHTRSELKGLLND